MDRGIVKNTKPAGRASGRSSGAVTTRARVGAKTQFKLSSGVTFELHPFAPLGMGDQVEILGAWPNVLLDSGAESIPLAPAWSTSCVIELCDKRIPLVIKEVETEAEYAALANLKQYHYRNDKTAGRAVPLIAVVDDPLLPPVVGFIEITSALLVNNARKAILDKPFVDTERGVVWQRWDMGTAKQQTKRLARISRCVVYPELRGLGVAAMLATAAVDYSRERWHYGGTRPLFLEITADMLRYSPFVNAAGFTYVGDTEGNEARVLKDMNYLLRRSLHSGVDRDFPKGGGGIMSLQRSYATTLLQVMSDKKISLEQLLNILRRNPESLTDNEWVAMHRVYRRPKPTYMVGLTLAAKRHLKSNAARVNATAAAIAPTKKEKKRPQLRPILTAVDIGLSTMTVPSSSSRGRKVAEAFGIVSKSVRQVLVENLNFCVNSSDIVLITGPSGTGKSLLLKAIAGASIVKSGGLPTGVDLHLGHFQTEAKTAWVQSERSSRSPVDILGEIALEDALVALSNAGLAEASIFVRPSNTLSDGQLYRLGIAQALAQRPNLLLVDAFCESLDDFSAATVCKKLRKLSRKEDLAIIVATATPGRILAELKPDTVIQFFPGRSVAVSTGAEFKERLNEN